MIHRYQFDGTNIVLDCNSGAVHVVEDIVYDLLGSLEKAPVSADTERLQKEFSGKYAAETIEEALGELAELCREGLLFSDDPYAEIAEKIQKQPVVKALCLHIAHDCNLRCKYCFAGTGEFCGERSMMSAEIGKKAIEFVIEHSGTRKNIEIDFFGGEPTMNFDVVKELVAYANRRGEETGKVFRLTLTTNGLLLDDEKLAFCNEHMSNMVLSIDGRPEVNDHMRKTVSGSGCYDIILPKFRRAAQSRNEDNYYVRGTFTRHNLDFSKDVLHLADLGFRQISVEPVVGGAECDYSLKEEDLPQIFSEYEALTREYVARWGTDRWFNFFHFMIDLDQGPCVIKRLSGCGAGCEYLAVTPEGDLYPCHQFVGNTDFCLGNVAGEYDLERPKQFANVNVYTKDACRNCWAKFYCSGGCHANAYSFNNTLEMPYSLGCEMEKKRVECAIYAEVKKREMEE